MELGGDEKKIQALFSELALENQSLAPQFEHLWTRCAVAPPREKTFIKPAALLASLLITVASALALGTWYRSTPTPTIANYVPHQPPVDVSNSKISETLVRATIKPRYRKHIKRQVDRSLRSEAALLSNWQSPTQRLIASPASVALDSLPQLNQSVKDLESFLSQKNEIMKESNR